MPKKSLEGYGGREKILDDLDEQNLERLLGSESSKAIYQNMDFAQLTATPGLNLLYAGTAGYMCLFQWSFRYN